MTGTRCTCGFAEADNVDETLDDHLLEMFMPDDGRGTDGAVHFEGEQGLFCLCGAGGTASMLDSHFLEVFAPPDSAGRDGMIHKAAG